MAHIPLSDGEWKLMNQLWGKSPATITQLTERLAPETGWSKHTVISLLKRMCQKGSAEVIPDTHPMQYRALLPRKEAVRQETRSVLRKAFGGRGALLIQALVEQEELTQAEIDGLLRELEQKKRGD